jgi:hypothetical protein
MSPEILSRRSPLFVANASLAGARALIPAAASDSAVALARALALTSARAAVMRSIFGLRRVELRLMFITTDKHNNRVAASATGTAHRGGRCSVDFVAPGGVVLPPPAPPTPAVLRLGLLATVVAPGWIASRA